MFVTQEISQRQSSDQFVFYLSQELISNKNGFWYVFWSIIHKVLVENAFLVDSFG